MYKFVYGQEIHACKQEIEKFEKLLDFIKLSFRQLPKNIKLTYLDNEGDEINLCNDEDLKALNQTKFTKKPKIQIKNMGGDLLRQEDLQRSQVISHREQISFHHQDERSNEFVLQDSGIFQGERFEMNAPKKQLDEETKMFIQEYINNEVKR